MFLVLPLLKQHVSSVLQLALNSNIIYIMYKYIERLYCMKIKLENMVAVLV